MIDSLMAWEESCSEDDLCLRLKWVTLKAPLGGFPRGLIFADALLDFKQGTLTLHTYDGFDHILPMKVIILPEGER